MVSTRSIKKLTEYLFSPLALFSGLLISDIHSPLTAGLAICIVVICIRTYMKNHQSTSNIAFWIAATLTVLLVLPIFWTTWTEYAVEKVHGLLFVTFITLWAPLFLAKDSDSIRSLIAWLTLMAAIISIVAFASMLSGDFSGRLSILGRGTWGLSRLLGVSAICFFILSVEKVIYFWIGITIAACSFILQLAPGQRGPVFAITIAVIYFSIWKTANFRPAIIRILDFAVLVTAGLAACWFRLPTVSVIRIANVFQERGGDASASERLLGWQLSWPEILRHPFGIGWGAFASLVDVGNPGMRYPHNLIIEIFLEAGWLAGIVLLISLFYVVWKNIISPPSIEAYFLITLLIYAFIAALFSGDINDGRMFFAFLSTSIIWSVHDPEIRCSS